MPTVIQQPVAEVILINEEKVTLVVRQGRESVRINLSNAEIDTLVQALLDARV